MGKYLIANGCSLVYGSEMDERTRERSTWVALLAKTMGRDLINLAIPGGSNDRIYRTTIEQVAKLRGEDLFVVVGWTNAHRFEIGRAATDDFLSIIPHCPVLPQAADDLRKLYMGHFATEREASTRMINHVLGLQSVLQCLGVPYHFSQVMRNYDERFVPAATFALIDQTHFPDFAKPKQNFMSYAKQRGAPVGPLGHPLKHGHREFFEYVWSQIQQATKATNRPESL